MEDKVIIGINLQYKLRLGILPPPKYIKRLLPKCSTIGELAVQTPEERERLRQFLGKELQQFEEIRRPTNKVEHHIRLKDEMAIKQRYRPRNPAMQVIIDKEVDE